tara:strand:+ start:362 stop:553 length:192 start_codon:yes stop_codon:yes gene_type:complete
MSKVKPGDLVRDKEDGLLAVVMSEPYPIGQLGFECVDVLWQGRSTISRVDMQVVKNRWIEVVK